MKRIERFYLIDRIGRELQATMTYRDIDVYLGGFGIETYDRKPSVNSKWVYVKELLADVPDETVLAIADDLEMEHDYRHSRQADLSDSRFWLAGHFRLFLSHVSSFKANTAQLQEVIRNYGISAFVAHEDIEPTREWQDEIEKALFSMDALAAILTPGFNESKWTDQEVGAALGRDVLIVPIRKGLNPYGFIAKYQGLDGDGKTIREVADELFHIVANHPKTKARMAGALVDQLLVAKYATDAHETLMLLKTIETLPERHLEKLRENVLSNEELASSSAFLDELNLMLRERELPIIAAQAPTEEVFDDDIPF